MRAAACAAFASLSLAVRAVADPVAVVNAGFEDPALDDNVSTDDALPGWTGAGGALADHNFGAFDPPTSFFPGEAPEGENVAYIQDGRIAQVLAATLEEGTYTLSVQVGQSLVDPASPFRVQLRAGDTVLDESTSPVATTGNFAEVTASYTAAADDPSLGEPLEIRLLDDGVPGMFADEPYFDDVALDFQPPCPSAPAPKCLTAAKASLAISEKKPGKEKLTAKLSGFGAATTQADLGNPASGTTVYRLCVYNPVDVVAVALTVDRAGENCGPKAKPCWKDKGGKGWSYKDPLAEASGVRGLAATSGASGKGKLQVKAGNNTAKNQAALPTGLAMMLQATTSVTLQVSTSDAQCFQSPLTATIADGEQFKAKAP
jgi:hypothetical protein